jgi:hypothetical protein
MVDGETGEENPGNREPRESFEPFDVVHTFPRHLRDAQGEKAS